MALPVVCSSRAAGCAMRKHCNSKGNGVLSSTSVYYSILEDRYSCLESTISIILDSPWCMVELHKPPNFNFSLIFSSPLHLISPEHGPQTCLPPSLPPLRFIIKLTRDITIHHQINSGQHSSPFSSRHRYVPTVPVHNDTSSIVPSMPNPSKPPMPPPSICDLL
jgi:hypothetical protein